MVARPPRPARVLTPADVDAIEAYAVDWLYTEECPAVYATRCGTR